MKELEMFSRFTLEQGNNWWELESSIKGSLHKSQRVYSDGRNDFYETPMYQVFDAKGKRVYVTPVYVDAFAKYRRL